MSRTLKNMFMSPLTYIDHMAIIITKRMHSCMPTQKQEFPWHRLKEAKRMLKSHDTHATLYFSTLFGIGIVPLNHIHSFINSCTAHLHTNRSSRGYNSTTASLSRCKLLCSHSDHSRRVFSEVSHLLLLRLPKWFVVRTSGFVYRRSNWRIGLFCCKTTDVKLL